MNRKDPERRIALLNQIERDFMRYIVQLERQLAEMRKLLTAPEKAGRKPEARKVS